MVEYLRPPPTSKTEDLKPGDFFTARREPDRREPILLTLSVVRAGNNPEPRDDVINIYALGSKGVDCQCWAPFARVGQL